MKISPRTLRSGLFLLAFLPLALQAQKSRVMSVFQMIEQGKYSEAKEAIELASWNEKTSRWPRTWYAKGLLCQTAYEAGYPSGDKKKTELYPDQLYLAYTSYEKAMELDARGRLTSSISQNYYTLSNDFRKLGSDHFRRKEYADALRAFEHALLINKSELVNAPVDTNLVYNTALAAYESENWDKAMDYLEDLHKAAHRPATSLLLYNASLASGDSLRAEEVLNEALKIYDYEQQVVVYLINLYVAEGQNDRAIKVLQEAIEHRPEVYQFHWGLGLIYRRTGESEKAIPCFRRAAELNPDEPKLFYHLGVIYYNQGIELKEEARRIDDREAYHKLRVQADEKFRESVQWLEKAYEMDPFDEKTISRLRQLYYQLKMKEKEESMRLLLGG